MSNPILSNLNPAQKEAVTWPHQPLLVLAGAGSGKTRILTRRIAQIISSGVPAMRVLAVTFTNKAAQEMKDRVAKLVRQDVWVSTFHSTCLRILRIEGAAIGLDPNFTIYDDSDQKQLIKECLKELQINEKRVHPKGVLERISRAKDVLMTPFQYAEKAPDLYEEAVAKVYRRYQERLETLRACDFGDLIMHTVRLFDQKADVLQSWQERFQHILIDEYQDTNHAQYRLVKLLAQQHKQITVVGDPDQSIYAWRGADIRNILNFEKDYPECGIIRMEQNYRSSATILKAANHLIGHNAERKPKNLWTDREEGEKITLLEARDEKEEAQYVIRQILKYRESGKTLADQVIFYRVHAQSRIFEDALRRANIPYKIVGGVRFYDRKEIKDVIAYLRVIQNPHDDVSLKRILNVPARGIGKKAVETLEEYSRNHACSLDDAIGAAVDSKVILPPKASKSITGFYRMLQRFRRMAKDMSVTELLENVLEATRYVQLLEDEKSTEAQARIENIEEFFSVIQDFEEEEKDPTLQAFLESISLVTNLDTWESGTDILTLMTLHTAKGLEFPIVYMVGMEEGIFPNANSYSEDTEELEEERRLCYVGITRAKDKLYMSCASQRLLYGSRQHNLPSRFLHEVPSEYFESTAHFFPVDDVTSEGEADDIEIEFDPEENKRRILFD